MNILYLLFSFTTGGTERLVTDICNEMAGRDHKVHLYVVNDHYDQSMLEGLDSRVRVMLQKRRPGGGSKVETLRRIAAYIRENRIEVVHCNSLAAPELLLLKPLCYPKVRVLFTVHNMTGYATLSRSKILLRNLLCHRLIAISESVKREMLRCGADPRKVAAVYNAIDLSRFSESGEREFEASAPVLGNVARIDTAVKGQDVLLRAVARLKENHPGIRCLFAGAADAAHRADEEALRVMASELGVAENVEFLGNVEDVPGFLRKIDVFVLPSRSEGFGISLIEAMAMGIPCAASNLDGPAEILQNGTYGELFPCGDDAALAAALEKLLSNRHESAARAARAREMVHKNFGIREMCDKLENLMK